MVDQLDERGRENNCFPVEEGLGKPWVSQSLQGGQRHKNLPVADFVLCPSRSSLAARRVRGEYMERRKTLRDFLERTREKKILKVY
ncbi:hypothetical protein A3A40_01330 [Candidatus Kaiserbacteria bacterium RIFCSPLOWO2_01_FULL_54_20]|uniref:Uncharacterized protein n=1 Tax=Candidatus Kaiserbacteria bacterium RIFCSPLOWO2_01_FULL_54_20 TaxID=1798513 RepID=A0A1F6EK37_9BACT|nr:MAG: hypothetical protein A3A40_01330 [Candidatus Kaiserbacteria bacterium RIFCSPLOWO2_01_FULL_54_20]